jgi:hypothetical protein
MNYGGSVERNALISRNTSASLDRYTKCVALAMRTTRAEGTPRSKAVA